MFDRLCATAERVGERLKARGETLAVGESSSGGLVSAALLAMPGASAFYVGGAVVYTGQARHSLLGLPERLPDAMRSASPPYASRLAETLAERMATTWAIAETGAAGPTGNRYGDDSGHSCLAVWGPRSRSRVIASGLRDRQMNMWLFAAGALDLLEQAVAEADG